MNAVRAVAFYAVMTSIGFVFLVPYIFTAFAAFKPINQFFSEPAWDPPHHLYLHNFSFDFSSGDFATYVANTFIVTAALTLGRVLFSMLGEYAFGQALVP